MTSKEDVSNLVLTNPLAPKPSASGRENVHDEENFDWNLDVILNLIALYLSYVAATWGLIALSVSIIYINAAFPGEESRTPWIAGVIGLAQCVLSLFIGELSDIFGRRYFMVLGNVSLLVGSLISSRADSVGVIIGGQVFTGMGVAMGYLATPLFSEIVPKRSRSVVVAAGSGALGLISSLGAVAIGAFQKYHVGGLLEVWRPAAYITAGLAFSALILILVFYHPSKRPNPHNLSTWQRMKAMDWFGVFIGTAGLTLLLLGLQFGGNPDSWSSARVVGLLVVGCICLVIFGIWEAYYVAFGLFPRPLFEHRNYSIVIATQFLEGMFINTGVAFLVQMQVLMYTDDPVKANIRNIPYGTMALFGAAVLGAVLYMTKETKWVVVLSVALAFIGTGLLSAVRAHSGYALWFFGTGLLGVATAGMGVGVVVIASLTSPNELIATALTILSSARGLGGAVGIVVFAQVFTAKVKAKLPVAIVEATTAAGLPDTSISALLEALAAQDQNAIIAVPNMSPPILMAIPPALRVGYGLSFAWMWYAMMPFVGVTLIAALFLKPTKALTTDEVASKIQRRFGRQHEKTSLQLEEKESEHNHIEDIR
jgi:MFS family permease